MRSVRLANDVREVPEPRLVASHVLVGSLRGKVPGLGIGIGGHNITDTTKRNQI